MLKSVLSVSVYRVSFSMCWGFYTTGTVLCIFIHTFGPIFLQCWLSETGRSNEHHADGLVSIPQIYLSPHTCIHVLRKSHLTPPPPPTHTHTHTHTHMHAQMQCTSSNLAFTWLGASASKCLEPKLGTRKYFLIASGVGT